MKSNPYCREFFACHELVYKCLYRPSREHGASLRLRELEIATITACIACLSTLYLLVIRMSGPDLRQKNGKSSRPAYFCSPIFLSQGKIELGDTRGRRISALDRAAVLSYYHHPKKSCREPDTCGHRSSNEKSGWPQPAALVRSL